MTSRTAVSPGPRILLTDSNRWPVTARLAGAFRGMGCEISVLCRIPHHPVQKVSGIRSIFPYNGRFPLASLRHAIKQFNPDVVVPSCDRGIEHLHELHAASSSAETADLEIAELIERSLGSPAGFNVVSSRRALLELAQSEGILVPRLAPVERESDLNAWSSQCMPSWVMKANGTWGGQGVRFVRDIDDARRFYLEYSRRNVLGLAKKLLCNHDWDWILNDWNHSRRSVIAQVAISGRPANCAVVCWQGKVLAGVAVEVIQAHGLTGPADIVRVVPGEAMIAAAQIIARRLEISGFFGLDFMIEDKTGDTYLIEMNPRCTPLSPLALGASQNLVAAYWAQLTGNPIPGDLPVILQSVIAYFPQAAEIASHAERADIDDSTYHDVPYNEPALVQEMLNPWSSRSFIGRWIDRIGQKQKQNMQAIAVFEGEDAHSGESVLQAPQ